MSGFSDSYYESGAVRELVRRGDELLGAVEGSQYTPYQVRVQFDIRDVLEAGQAEAALSLLEPLTDEYVQEWTWLDDSDGFVHAFFYDLGPVWTEALLAADLDDDARNYWADRLDAWQSKLYDYGLEEVFFSALAVVDARADSPWTTTN